MGRPALATGLASALAVASALAPGFARAELAPAPPLTAQQYFTYEQQKKNPLLGLGLGVVPGLGSLYGDHLSGALVSWGGLAVGIPLVVLAVQVGGEKDSSGQTHIQGAAGGVLLTTGIVLILASEIYSVVDGYRAPKAHNAALARRLGFPDPNLALVPVTTDRGLAWGPALTVRF